MNRKANAPEPPEHLDDEGRRKWSEVVEMLIDRGDTLDAGNLDAATCYASAWARLLEAESKLRELGCVIRTAAGFAAVSPYASVQKDAARQLRQFGQMLRLDRPARAKPEPESSVARILRTMDTGDSKTHRRRATA